MERYPNGQPLAVYHYSGLRDTIDYDITTYYDNGKIYKAATIRNGKYVGKKITYFRTGGIYQIDSLAAPADRLSKVWSGRLIRYNPNGTLSQRFTVVNGHFFGLSEHYDDSGRLVKLYYLKDDTVKNGPYVDFYENGKKNFQGTFVDGKLFGLSYFFSDKGDTLSYTNNIEGHSTLPAKKWYKNYSVYGDYTDSNKSKIMWTWFDSLGHFIKYAIHKTPNKGFVIPE